MFFSRTQIGATRGQINKKKHFFLFVCLHSEKFIIFCQTISGKKSFSCAILRRVHQHGFTSLKSKRGWRNSAWIQQDLCHLLLFLYFFLYVSSRASSSSSLLLPQTPAVTPQGNRRLTNAIWAFQRHKEKTNKQCWRGRKEKKNTCRGWCWTNMLLFFFLFSLHKRPAALAGVEIQGQTWLDVYFLFACLSIVVWQIVSLRTAAL